MSATVSKSPENNTPLESGRRWTSVWSDLIDTAKNAPSGDNGQPWLLRESLEDQNCASLTIRPEENLTDTDGAQLAPPLAFLDFNGEATRIAFGCFLEDLCLRASARQQRVYIEGTKDVSASEMSVNLRLKNEASMTKNRLADYITSRHSNRNFQLAQPLPQEIIKSLNAAATNVDGIETNFISDRKTIQTLADAVAIADHVRFLHPQCHKEFHEKIRWTQKAAKINPTGFSPNTFAINAFQKSALWLTSNYKLLKLVSSILPIGWLAARDARQRTLNSSAIGAICGDPNSDDFWMNVGRVLQRIWLEVTACQEKIGNRELGLQVLAVAPILTRRFEIEGGKTFTPQNGERLKNVRSLLSHAIPGKDIALLFRVGFARPISARTERLPWKSLAAPRIE